MIRREGQAFSPETGRDIPPPSMYAISIYAYNLKTSIMDSVNRNRLVP